MNGLSILAIAAALSMDAFTVALAVGTRMPDIRINIPLRLALIFGGFQFIMPIIGWVLGFGLKKYIDIFDHWLAFFLLAFVGAKMIREAWKNKNEQSLPENFIKVHKVHTLFLLGIATSLDALAVGLTLAMLNTGIWFPATIIGLICFLFTIAGALMGSYIFRCSFLKSLGNKAGAFGGLVLFIIGIKILYEHGALPL